MIKNYCIFNMKRKQKGKPANMRLIKHKWSLKGITAYESSSPKCGEIVLEGKNSMMLQKSSKGLATVTLILLLNITLLISAISVGCTFTVTAGEKTNKECEIEEDKIIYLADKEVEQYNKVFQPIILDQQGNSVINPYSHFFTSYYDRPEDIDLSNFLRYFPSEEDVTDKTEFNKLKADKNWPFGADIALERMPVPIHKFPAKTVNQVLRRYMGITLEDLSGVGSKDLIYVKEYDAYYNYTSDFAAGIFYCTHGETQGDIVRLFNEFVTLTLKKQGDDYLFISHKLIGEGTAFSSPAGDFGVAIGIKPRGHIPQAVLNHAVEFVTQQIDYYNAEGKSLQSGMGKFAITKARIVDLTKMNTDTANTDPSLDTGIQMWLLEYRLRPDNPDKVVVAGGMRTEDIDGETWITEWGSTGQPYLLLEHNIEEDTWEKICVTNTDVIMSDYGTPEMIKTYGNQYTAAVMELYKKKTTNQINEISQEEILKYKKEGIYIPGDAIKYIEKKEFNNPSLFVNKELQIIFDKYKETLDDNLLIGLRPIDIFRLHNKAIEEENIEVGVSLVLLLPEINKQDFLKEIKNDKVSKENQKLQLEKYSKFNGKVMELIVNEDKAYVIIQGEGFWRFEKTENDIWKLGWLARQ